MGSHAGQEDCTGKDQLVPSKISLSFLGTILYQVHNDIGSQKPRYTIDMNPIASDTNIWKVVCGHR